MNIEQKIDNSIAAMTDVMNTECKTGKQKLEMKRRIDHVQRNRECIKHWHGKNEIVYHQCNTCGNLCSMGKWKAGDTYRCFHCNFLG